MDKYRNPCILLGTCKTTRGRAYSIYGVELARFEALQRAKPPLADFLSFVEVTFGYNTHAQWADLCVAAGSAFGT